MKDVVIVSAVRTPFGKFGGSLKNFKATDLGGLAIKEALKRDKYEGAIAEKLKLIGDRRYNIMFFFLKRKLLMPIVLITRIYYLIRNICPN